MAFKGEVSLVRKEETATVVDLLLVHLDQFLLKLKEVNDTAVSDDVKLAFPENS